MINSRSAKSFVTIMIVIAICALFLRITIERLIKYNISQNGSIALSTVKLISTALENYAKDNHGVYPASLTVLTKTKPAYLDRDYTSSPFKGYNYSCSMLESSGYSCNATPARCGISGITVYIVTTGSSLITQECEKRE